MRVPDRRLLDTEGGVVVVTRFECKSIRLLVWVIVTHRRLEKEVFRHASGVVASGQIVQWSLKRVYSISLWDDANAIYSMGEVNAHVAAARSAPRLGIDVVAGIYPYMGHWANLLFGATAKRDPPF